MSDSERNDGKAPRLISHGDFNRLILTVLGIGLVVVLALGITIVWLGAKTREYNSWVEHTYVAEQKIVAFQASVERVETTRRGYLLGPTPAQYATYLDARGQVATALYALASTVQDNTAQLVHITRIKPILSWKTKINDDSVAEVRAGRREQAVRAFSDEQSLQPLLGIRDETRRMLAEEQRLLALRTAQESDAVRVLLLVGLATAVLLGLLSISSMLVMRRFASDLTAAQEELRALNADLEQRVVERTSDLTRANAEIQRFAYIVSHDLRSPLVNVMGFTAELEVAMKPLRALVRWIEERDTEGKLPPEIKQSVDVEIPEAIGFIRGSTKKMDGLIGAILKLSREGSRVLHPEPLALTPLIDGLFGTVRHRLAELGGDAVVEGEMPEITTDRMALEQVLGNLIDNAVKYHSPTRPLRIAVRASRIGGQVAIEVTDNGRGIAPKDHERVFELFRRSGPQNQPGEGIGLAHVRALVHRLGGAIECTSALDQGATFRVSLPRFLNVSEGLAA